jgi:hypothetical protein
MEMSSPLAAMRPPPVPGPWGYRRDLPSSRPLFGAHSLGPKSFNFRDLSMKKPSMDYFNMQPMRGSSPTASLAADMSSNLHVDQRYRRPCIPCAQMRSANCHCYSPQFATPRRSLFAPSLSYQGHAHGM